jgi:hypothetical protein
MRHHYLDLDATHGAHYAVAISTFDEKTIRVLVQLQDDCGEQVRISLTKDEAQHMVQLLTSAINEL